MMDQPAAMHVARIKSSHTDKQGRAREYESRLLRHTYRDGGKVRHKTLANLSRMPDHVVDAVEAALKGEVLVPAGEAAVTVARSLPHGNVAAVYAMARKLGLPALLGPSGRQRDLALALIISRIAHPGSKLSTLAWWGDVTLGADLGIGDATTDEAYAAMDWLQARQDAIENELARRHLAPEANPSRMALFDPSSSWLEGTHCPLGARGYSRDGKKGNVQIEYGLLTDPQGRPVAVRVFEGNTADPAAFTEILGAVHDDFQLSRMVMAGDRGMITAAPHRRHPRTRRQICVDHRAARPRHPQAHGRRRPAPAVPVRRAGPRRDHQRRLPRRAPHRLPQPRTRRRPRPQARGPPRRHREAARPDRRPRRFRQAVRGRRDRKKAGEVIGKYKMRKHFEITITDDSLAAGRKQDQIDAEAQLDGIYVIRTPLPAGDLGTAGAVTAYKNLKHVERSKPQCCHSCGALSLSFSSVSDSMLIPA